MGEMMWNLFAVVGLLVVVAGGAMLLLWMWADWKDRGWPG